ncbi:MAG TPA: response regulator [Thermodesulfobacteriota bacterium]|nr:response regulator [Deltaproteobacteria bacterium]HNR11799.1 response regulator [Thermodesulfobacteriota bacterium]HNU71561.1 response regulator [Thermodesulfobacteriota bacterium]HOC37677.1 response regulator [Thermodesulfobacteriota bacterium]HQO77583.1 response regulator [Thermodesulfobacteriota bacterium]
MAEKPSYQELEKRLRQQEKHLEEAGVKLNELQRSREQLQEVLDSSRDILYRRSLDRDVFDYISPAAEEITGYSPEELMRLTRQDLCQLVHPDDLPTLIAQVHQAMQGPDYKIIYSLEYRLKRKNGSYVTLNDRCTVFRNTEGTPSFVVGVSRDVTDQIRTDDEKKKLAAQLGHAQKMEAVGTLAGGIAHDFNNLLMGIQGRVSLISVNTSPEHPNHEHLKSIEVTVQRGAELTRQLLGFARSAKHEVKPTAMNTLVERTAAAFGRTRKEIIIHQDYDDSLWTVNVDQIQTEQVLLNLFVNASQAMPGGGHLTLTTKNVTLDEKESTPHAVRAGKYVLLTVTDTGSGMDETTMQRIFEPFFTTREIGRGTGLGLSSAYGIMKNFGGFITVQSAVGCGSTFSLYLPAAEKKAVAVVTPSQPEKRLTGNETILLVDDEEMILEVGEKLLSILGYSVIVARSGKDALEIVRQQEAPIDLVILDMVMSGMDGQETFSQLKKISPDIKVLLSSGYSLDSQAVHTVERGCDGFIQKPFSLKDLAQKVRYILTQVKKDSKKFKA